MCEGNHAEGGTQQARAGAGVEGVRCRPPSTCHCRVPPPILAVQQWQQVAQSPRDASGLSSHICTHVSLVWL